MAFKLPENLASTFSRATSLELASGVSLRCRWPSTRDLVWATTLSDRLSNGQMSNNSAYAVGIVAASLIGINDQELSELADDATLKELLLKDEAQLSDAEHRQLCDAKYANIVAAIPGNLLVSCYYQQFAPWVEKQEKDQAEQAQPELDKLDELVKRIHLLEEEQG